MSLLNSVIIIIAFLFLVFTFPPGALAVVIVWLCLQFIKKRRRVNEMQENQKTQQKIKQKRA